MGFSYLDVRMPLVGQAKGPGRPLFFVVRVDFWPAHDGHGFSIVAQSDGVGAFNGRFVINTEKNKPNKLKHFLFAKLK